MSTLRAVSFERAVAFSASEYRIEVTPLISPSPAFSMTSNSPSPKRQKTSGFSRRRHAPRNRKRNLRRSFQNLSQENMVLRHSVSELSSVVAGRDSNLAKKMDAHCRRLSQVMDRILRDLRQHSSQSSISESDGSPPPPPPQLQKIRTVE